MQVVSAMIPRVQIVKQPAFVWRKPAIFTSPPRSKLSVVTFPLATFHLTTVALRNRRTSLARQQSTESEDSAKVAVKHRQIFKDVEFPENLSGRLKIEYALWGVWRKMGNPKPPSKEIKECLAFFNGCSRELGHKKLLVDAAGGHGGIALVFRAYRRVEKAVVVDLYEPQSFENLRGAWLPDESPSVVKFCAGDISEAGWLSSLLAREEVDASEVMVVACHACSMLSDELIRECVQCKVEFAIMPCCQGEDSRKGKMMLNAARNLNMPMGQLIDIARLGVIEASPGYKATLKRIDENITPQNRILIGLRETTKDVVRRYADRERFLQRMAKKYRHVAWRPKDQFIASSNPG